MKWTRVTGWNGVVERDCNSRSPPDRDARLIAPEAGALVVGAVDGFVGPFGGRGGGRGGVEVVGRGVLREEDEALAIPTVHADLDHLQLLAVPLPAPADEDMAALRLQADLRLECSRVQRRGARPLDAEQLADGGAVGRVGLDLADEGAEARLNARRHGGHGRGQQDFLWRAAEGAAAAIAHLIAPGRPLLGVVCRHILALDEVGIIRRVCRLSGELGGGETERSGVSTDVELKGSELGSKVSITIFDVVGFSHSKFAFGLD